MKKQIEEEKREDGGVIPSRDKQVFLSFYDSDYYRLILCAWFVVIVVSLFAFFA